MQPDIPLNERIIFALDVPSPDEALALVRELDGHVKFFKVGLQLFLAGWWPVIDEITRRGNKVMLDLKFFDIDKTVELAVREAARHQVAFATVHGNEAILKAAVRAKGAVKILAVTFLTSFDQDDLNDLGMTCSVEAFVASRASRAVAAGCDGVVASGLEASRLRAGVGDHVLIVTPGIRPGTFSEDETGDEQKRIVTAEQAVINGADHVVVGRPIRDAQDRLAVVKRMQGEIARGLARA